MDARRRIETENTAPLVTDTQTNAPRATVDKNCNATAAEPIQGAFLILNLLSIKFTINRWRHCLQVTINVHGKSVKRAYIAGSDFKKGACFFIAHKFLWNLWGMAIKTYPARNFCSCRGCSMALCLGRPLLN